MNWRSARRARGGDIVLRKRWMRTVFQLGLAAPIALALILMFVILAR